MADISDVNEVHIREARLEDLKRIIELLRDDPHAVKRESDSAEALVRYGEAFKEILVDTHAELLVLAHHDEVIGVAQMNYLRHLTYQGGLRAQIEGVRIDKAYRSMGLGKWFFENMITRAEQRNCHLVQLTTDVARHEALAFYKKLGFEHTHHGLKKHL